MENQKQLSPLDAISAEALAAEDAANVSGDTALPGVPVGPVIDPAQEWRDAAHMGCGIVVAMRPELAAEWTPAVLDRLGDALAKCGERYGWTVQGIFGHPLVGLAFATFPMVTALVRVERARAEEKARKLRENPAVSPGAAAAEAAAGSTAFAKAPA